MTDTNCQRASQSLYETIAVSLFARLPPRALLAASPLARDSCSATFPRGFSSKRETARSLQLIGSKRCLIKTKMRMSIMHKMGPKTKLLSLQRHSRCHFVSYQRYITGAKFEQHHLNISRDILDFIIYFSTDTICDVITF